MPTCPSCHSPLEDSLKFCPHCGCWLALSCPKCGADVEVVGKFCSKCGAALEPVGATKKRV